MSFMQEISESEIKGENRSGFLGGSDISALMGHGYFEVGEDHMDAIMSVWERKRGLGARSKQVTEAMQAGVEQEPTAYLRLLDQLRLGQLNATDDRYGAARLYMPFKGLRLQHPTVEGYGDAGNLDAALFNVQQNQIDPITGREISGEDYARRYAEEYRKIQMQTELNHTLDLDGEPLIEISTPKYSPPPFAGAIDIKVTTSASVFYDEIYNGIDPRHVVQAHQYLGVLRKESRKMGFADEHDPELLGVFRFCLENNKTKFHEIQYDPDLSTEMERRRDIFIQKCLIEGIPPNSSELRDDFYIYPVKGTEPEAILASPEIEDKLKVVLAKLTPIKLKMKELEAYESNIHASLQRGIEAANADSGHFGKPRGVFVDGKLIKFEEKVRTKKITSEAKLNGVLAAGGEAKQVLSTVEGLLSDQSKTAAEKLEAISLAMRNAPLNRLPDAGAEISDYQIKQKIVANEPSFQQITNKTTRSLYIDMVAARSPVGVVSSSPEKGEQANRSLQNNDIETKLGASTDSTATALDKGQRQSNELSSSVLEDEGGSSKELTTPPTPVQHQETEKHQTTAGEIEARRNVEKSNEAELSPAELASSGELISNLHSTPHEVNEKPKDFSGAKAFTPHVQSQEQEYLTAYQDQPPSKGPNMSGLPLELLEGDVPEVLFADTNASDIEHEPDSSTEASGRGETFVGLATSPFGR